MYRFSLALLSLCLIASGGPLVNPFVSFPAGGSSYDTDADAYFTRASITDSASKTKISDLVVALKAEGIWTSLTDIWLLRPLQQNTGGTTVYALKSNSNNGTLQGSVAYGTAGLQFRAQAHVITTPITQTMNHDWTAGLVFKFITMPAGYPRPFGPTTGTGGPALMYWVNGSTLASPTMGSYSIGQNPTRLVTGNIGNAHLSTSAYNHSAVQWQAFYGGTAMTVNTVAGPHVIATHSLSISYNSNQESINNADVYLVYLYSTTRITNTNIANLNTAIKTTVCSDLSLP